jgi:tetratricopeptide (TPR) repeat protein
MTRGAVAASGARKADLLAHIGWATFYKSLEGASAPDLTPQYQAALAEDPANPFAHAFLGHWIVWSRGSLESAMKEFDAAVAANRSRPFVRMVQRHALRRRGQSADGTLIAMVNEMRRNGETVGPTIVSDVDSVYWFACGTYEKKDDMRVLLDAAPPADQVVTYRALFYDASGKNTDASRAKGRNACLATLLEAAGQKDEALKVWREVRQEFKPKDVSQLADRADVAIRRLSAR